MVGKVGSVATWSAGSLQVQHLWAGADNLMF
jgi:hypothetical protein